MNKFEQFKQKYDELWDRTGGQSSAFDDIENIYRSYGLSEEDGDMYECFVALPDEGQNKVLSVLNKHTLDLGDPGYAEQLYLDALESYDPYRDSFNAGVVEFYNALRAEGIDLGF